MLIKCENRRLVHPSTDILYAFKHQMKDSGKLQDWARHVCGTGLFHLLIGLTGLILSAKSTKR